MTDLSTLSGQLAHYAAVRARLSPKVPEPVAPTRSRFVNAGWQPHRPMHMPFAVPRISLQERIEGIRTLAKRSRDYLNIATSPLDTSIHVQRMEWRRIVMEVAAKHDLTVMDIIGSARSRPVINARHEAYYRLRHETPLSMPEIGKRLGDKDHTSVLHGIRKHAERMKAQNASNGIGA